MADLWLPNAAVVFLPGKYGGRYDRTDRKKLMIHTTEGRSISGAINAYAPFPPHLIASYEQKKIIQHIPLNLYSYSMKNSESEDEPVIQLEITGFAKESRNWPRAMLNWLVDSVFIPIRDLWPFDLAGPPQGFKDGNDSVSPPLASTGSPIRFTMSEFERFSGICGHQHAPAPDSHWDPGHLDIDYILDRLRAHYHPVVRPPTKEDIVDFSAIISYIELCYAAANQSHDNVGKLWWAEKAHANAAPLEVLHQMRDALGVTNMWTSDPVTGAPIH